MATVTETPSFSAGIYRIETSDPIIGGEDGIANIQAKQLANRTAYLKARADQVDDAAGETGSLPERLNILQAMAEAVGPEMQNATVGAVKFAIDQAGQANAGIRFLRSTWTQRGMLTIVNRGVVTGCDVTKSTTATRNLNLSAGRCFALGRDWPVAAALNSASVPSNPGSGAVSVTAYLYLWGVYNYSLAVTAEGEEVPDFGIPIYDILIPAGNTDATDPSLGDVTLTDIRRIEPNFPTLLDEPCIAFGYIRELADWDYHLSLYAECADNRRMLPDILAVNQASNGFMLRLCSVADPVYVHWQVLKLEV